ncbi:TIGR03943 family protein [Natronosporangium hydrolyticum]|uniref:TIGR03943 family protein n=1 Tax=Natronosporangium hydrolyticum TaxID=2811111 RepID=A0A895YCM0_9ACTN|nr:TIGR03943 family protein [Natronosporangium hydrolyticum]QSB13193.1 TIGR03943 family protein [Natronosporangium hydrolyticum]
MNRLAQGVVMLLFGGAVLRASLTDMYLRYVKDTLQPFLIVASGLLIVAGGMTLWYELRRDRREPPPDDGHGHGHREPRVAWLLVAPVLGLLLVSPPALGSYSAGTTGTALSIDQRPADFPPLPEVSLVELPVLDYASRAVWDEGRSLADRRIQLTGFLTSDRRGGADEGEQEQFLARLVLSCCAADARPIKVGMVGAEAPVGLADDTWVAVIGTYVEQTTVDPINEATIPYIEVETWEVVPPPDRPYE